MLRVVHGLAGSAAIALLVLATSQMGDGIPARLWWGNNPRQDSYHGCHSGAFHVFEQALAKDEFAVPVLPA